MIISFDISVLPLNPLISGGNKRANVLKQICRVLLHVGSSTYDLLILPGNKGLKSGRNNVSSFMFIRKNVWWNTITYAVFDSEEVARRCSVKKVFLEIGKIHRKAPVPECYRTRPVTASGDCDYYFAFSNFENFLRYLPS